MLVVGLGINHLLPDKGSVVKNQASRYMDEMTEVVRNHCLEKGMAINLIDDPYGSGLIGREWTEMTTTLGHVEAKRSTLNPNFAALLVTLLQEANVGSGDSIVLASSGSFPGLLLASLSAAKAMGLHCQTILSLGASSYGANRMDLNILDIYNLLMNNELVTDPPVAVSLGGEQDSGLGWDEKILNELVGDIERSG